MPLPPTSARTAALVANLARALRAELIETHISWVLLTGHLAYKVKKPVRLPFVDYGTLDARGRFCEEEVRLNRRLAPTLYLGVSRITGSPDAPALDGPGPVLEYAVRMRRFAAGALFGEQVQAGTLAGGDVDELAALLAGFHTSPASVTTLDGFASPEGRRFAALAALDGAAPIASDAAQAHLRGWLERAAGALAPLWRSRRNGVHVRDCHGDLHLDNLVRLDREVAAFDCIEFDRALRCIDVVDDIALPSWIFASEAGAISRSGFSMAGWTAPAITPRCPRCVFRWCTALW